MTASCQDIKPALSQPVYANKKKKPLIKSPLVPTVPPVQDRSSCTSPLLGSPRGEPGEARPGQLSPLLQAPLVAPTPPCLSARPHPKAAMEALILRKKQAPDALETAAHG